MSDATIDAVLARLGLSRPARADREWLARAYRAWNLGVPFTNLAKLRAIRAGEPLPSLRPEAIFEQFLEDGTCGTCFSHAVAFCALLEGVGYQARNVVGHTEGDDGVRGAHATTLVSIDDDLFMVDTALPHGAPLPLYRDRPSSIDGVMTPMTATPEGELWRLDFVIVHDGDRRRAHLSEALRDLDHAEQWWRSTLEEAHSPFNKLPVARLETPTGVLTLAGSKLFVWERETGVQVEPAGPETLERFGIRPEAYEPLWSRRSAGADT